MSMNIWCECLRKLLSNFEANYRERASVVSKRR